MLTARDPFLSRTLATHTQVGVKFTFQTGKSPKVTTVYQIGGVDKSNEKGTTWWVRPWLGFFYLPVKLPYYVIDVDTENYSYLTASSPSTTGMASWLYIMTREKVVDEAFLEPLKRRAGEAGWDMSKTERCGQDPQVPSGPAEVPATASVVVKE